MSKVQVVKKLFKNSKNTQTPRYLDAPVHNNHPKPPTASSTSAAARTTVKGSEKPQQQAQLLIPLTYPLIAVKELSTALRLYFPGSVSRSANHPRFLLPICLSAPSATAAGNERAILSHYRDEFLKDVGKYHSDMDDINFVAVSSLRRVKDDWIPFGLPLKTDAAKEQHLTLGAKQSLPALIQRAKEMAKKKPSETANSSEHSPSTSTDHAFTSASVIPLVCCSNAIDATVYMVLFRYCSCPRAEKGVVHDHARCNFYHFGDAHRQWDICTQFQQQGSKMGNSAYECAAAAAFRQSMALLYRWWKLGLTEEQRQQLGMSKKQNVDKTQAASSSIVVLPDAESGDHDNDEKDNDSQEYSKDEVLNEKDSGSQPSTPAQSKRFSREMVRAHAA